jgi:hypothetical protein
VAQRIQRQAPLALRRAVAQAVRRQGVTELMNRDRDGEAGQEEQDGARVWKSDGGRPER